MASPVIEVISLALIAEVTKFMRSRKKFAVTMKPLLGQTDSHKLSFQFRSPVADSAAVIK